MFYQNSEELQELWLSYGHRFDIVVPSEPQQTVRRSRMMLRRPRVAHFGKELLQLLLGAEGQGHS